MSEASVVACCFSPCGQMFVTGCTRGDLKLWDMDVNLLHAEKDAHDMGVTCCSFAPQFQISGCSVCKGSFQPKRFPSCSRQCLNMLDLSIYDFRFSFFFCLPPIQTKEINYILVCMIIQLVQWINYFCTWFVYEKSGIVQSSNNFDNLKKLLKNQLSYKLKY